MQTVALVAKTNNPEAVSLARHIKERYSTLNVLSDPDLARAAGWDASVSETELGAGADLVIVLGGDGTLLRAARMLQGRPVPILGINMGTLGFMTEVPQSELFPMLEAALAGKTRLESRYKLNCKLVRDNTVVVEDEVLNDVVISKGALARIVDHETFIDGQFVTLFKADGVIVSSPTGSTAYSLSAHGPIVHPGIDCMVVTPICPHSLTQRPIVVAGDSVIRLAIRSDSSEVYLTLDGQIGHALQTGDSIEVSRSKNKVVLVRNPVLGYYAILRQKLHWGER